MISSAHVFEPQQEWTEHDTHLESGNRELQTADSSVDTCYCPIGKPAPCPPTEEEFVEVFNKDVHFLVDEKKLTLVTCVENVAGVIQTNLECYSYNNNTDCGEDQECLYNTSVALGTPGFWLVWFEAGQFGDSKYCYAVCLVSKFHSHNQLTSFQIPLVST